MSELSKQQCFHNTYGATKSWSCSHRALVLFLCPSGRTNHNTNIKHGVEPSDHNKTSAKSYDVAHFVSKLAGAVQKPPSSSLHPAQRNHTVRTANKNLSAPATISPQPAAGCGAVPGVTGHWTARVAAAPSSLCWLRIDVRLVIATSLSSRSHVDHA